MNLFPGDAWDFSDSTYGTFSTYDLTYGVTTAQGIWRGALRQPSMSRADMMHAFIGMTYIGYSGTVYDKLEEAPTDQGLYEQNWVLFPGEVYVVLTRENHYAKISITQAGGLLTFKYTYQDDGSTSFRPSVATRQATWGRIKALYQ